MKTNALVLATIMAASSASAAELATMELPFYSSESEYVVFRVFDDISTIEGCEGKPKATATYHIAIVEGKVDEGCWYMDDENEIVYLQLQRMRAPYVIHKNRFNANYASQEPKAENPLAGICPVTPQQ